MRLRRLAQLFLLSLALALPACAEDTETTLQGIVTWVHDGDTLEIDTVGKVRLIGIDTPERENSHRDQYLIKQGVPAPRQREMYRAAKQFNIEQVKGRQVSLILDTPERDRHDRLLAYVYLSDGRLLNRTLIEQGLAVVYKRFSFRLKEDFLKAEEKARQAGVGLWTKEKNAKHLKAL